MLWQILSVGQVTLMVHWVAVEAAVIGLVGAVAVWTWSLQRPYWRLWLILVQLGPYYLNLSALGG